jgi:hypothetical protein
LYLAGKKSNVLSLPTARYLADTTIGKDRLTKEKHSNFILSEISVFKTECDG